MMEEVNNNVPFNIKMGDKFQDLEQFEIDLREQCKSKFVQLYRKEARTIESAMKKKIIRYMDPVLKYYSIRWCCIHGGRKFQTRGKGMRKTSTLRKDDLCPVYIQVRIAESGKEFIVVSVNFEHNHIVVELYKQLPHNRRLPDDVKADVKKLLAMKTDKHMLRKALQIKLGQTVTLKDLTNLQQAAKFIQNDTQISSHVNTAIAESRKETMTSQEKYRQTFIKAKLMASLACDLCEDKYRNLNSIIDAIISDLQNERCDFVDNALFLIGPTRNTHSSTDSKQENSTTSIQEDTWQNDFVTEGALNTQNQIEPDSPQNVPEAVNWINILSEKCDALIEEEEKEGEESDDNNEFDLHKTKVPIRKRSGSDVTMSELPKRRKKSNRSLPYLEIPIEERVDILLKWIMKDVEVVKTRQIDMSDLLPQELMDLRILEVNITALKKFFYEDAWQQFKVFRNSLRQIAKWTCNYCGCNVDDKDPTICCDYCLKWYHIRCAGTTSVFRESFMCESCK